MSTDVIRAVAVVIPVHDEAALLHRCLLAVRAAVREVDPSVQVIVRVVLDDCTDQSPALVRAHRLVGLPITANAVGRARAVGTASALQALRGIPRESIWTAHTDGDSEVPAGWLTTQLAAAHRGADVFLGTVRPDFADLTAAHREHWIETHAGGRGVGNVHGANLGIRASTYLAAGGFASVTEHEDAQLVASCRRRGARIAASGRAEVLTSGRLFGRTPGGYAAFVREQAAHFGGAGSAETSPSPRAEELLDAEERAG
ncbi:glycosyltransferase [Microbacterium sp. P01]|uniref:glycosyltransferase n=1 Tax=Microbacterium sp. P01 TaxID=3366261 RepID=UPI00366EEFD3